MDLNDFDFEEDPTLDLCDGEEYQRVLDEQGKPVYQLQGIADSDEAALIRVGISVDPIHPLIGEFEINRYYNARITSHLYHDDELDDPKSSCWLPMAELEVLKNKNRWLSICFSFHTFSHLKSGRSLPDLLDDQARLTLSGFFRITLHQENKYLVLETLNRFPGHQQMIDRLIEWVKSDEVNSYLFKNRTRK